MELGFKIEKKSQKPKKGYMYFVIFYQKKAKWFAGAPLPQFDTAAPAGLFRPSQEPPVEPRMSSVHRLLIFHASIGTEHVQNQCPLSSPCTCLVTFDVLQDKNQILTRGAPSSVWVRRMLAESAAERRPAGGRLCSLLCLRKLDPIMLPFKCFVTRERAERFWFASPEGRVTQSQCWRV